MSDEARSIASCQAQGCPREPSEGVLLRLDPRQKGGLEVWVCPDHQRKLAQLGAKTRDEVGLGIDQDDEGDDDDP
jgi:hypothetical protein